MDKQDTQKLLQQLGKEAKRRQEEAAAQAKRQRRDEPDFAAAVGKVTPLKNSNRVAAPKDDKPLKFKGFRTAFQSLRDCAAKAKR